MVLSQPGQAQDGTAAASGEPGWITEKEEKVRERLRALLLREPSRDLEAGWQLAADLGRPVSPLLWSLFDQEQADVDGRLVLLAAAAIAGGRHEDERLLAWLGQHQKKAMLEERVLAAMVVAMGPARPRQVANFWSLFFGASTKSPEAMLAIMVRLASARFPELREGAPTTGDSDDPGLAAATAFAGLLLPDSVATRLWNAPANDRHADLFRRGALLGAARLAATQKVPDELLERTRRVMARSEEGPAVAAAAWLRAVTGDLAQDAGGRMAVPRLRVASAHAGTAMALQAQFAPEPQPSDEDPRRLAVAYALTRPLQVVIDERARWAASPKIRRHVAVALAFRLATGAPRAPIDVELPAVAEWAFVRAASGGKVTGNATGSVAVDDPKLAAALPLLANGRLDRQALADLLEETLWRWESHPNRVPWDLERVLLRDLVLAGSKHGGSKYQSYVPPDDRYSPRGFDRSSTFFTIAVPLYEFMRLRSPLPPEYRLPR